MTTYYNPWQRYERHRRAKAPKHRYPAADYLRCMAVTAAFTVAALVIFITR